MRTWKLSPNELLSHSKHTVLRHTLEAWEQTPQTGPANHKHCFFFSGLLFESVARPSLCVPLSLSFLELVMEVPCCTA